MRIVEKCTNINCKLQKKKAEKSKLDVRTFALLLEIFYHVRIVNIIELICSLCTYSKHI